MLYSIQISKSKQNIEIIPKFEIRGILGPQIMFELSLWSTGNCHQPGRLPGTQPVKPITREHQKTQNYKTTPPHIIPPPRVWHGVTASHAEGKELGSKP